MLASLHQASFWECEDLVQVKAICLNHPVRALLDLCSEGPLDVYLKQHAPQVSMYHLMSATEQISQAICYLVSASCVPVVFQVQGLWKKLLTNLQMTTSAHNQ